MIRFECKLLIASAQYVAAFFHRYNIKELANRITMIDINADSSEPLSRLWILLVTVH